jgi:hypothetical protein
MIFIKEMLNTLLKIMSLELLTFLKIILLGIVTPLLPKVIDKRIINCNTKKYQNHNRFKQYLLADSGYDSIENHRKLIMKGYVPLIVQNRRNIKNKKLIRKMNNKQKEIYKKRTIIENYHSWIKKFSKIKSLYERNA